MKGPLLPEIYRRWSAALVAMSLFVGVSLFVAAGVAALAQGQPRPEDDASSEKPTAEQARPLIDREPYDLLTIRSGQNQKTLEIRRLVAPDGGPLKITDTDGRLTVELVEHPGRQFAIATRHVERHQTFPELLLEEARRQLEQKRFDLAFRYLQRLRDADGDIPGADQLLENLLVQNAVERFQSGALAEALGMLEEAQRRNPKRPGLNKSIKNVAQRMVQQQVDRADWSAARALVARFEQDGPSMEELVRTWRQEFTRRAKAGLAEAQQLAEAGNLRDALEQTREALRIDPRSASAKRQLRSLVERYPLVRIATLAPGNAEPPHETLTWTGRRNKRLLYRDLCEIVGYGPEGGEYLSPFGTVLRQIDGMQVSIMLRDRLTPVTGHHLSRHLLEDAASAHPKLSPLTRLIERLAVHEVRQLDVHFQVPHVRPESLLTFVPRTSGFSNEPVPQNGAFVPLEDGTYQVFVRKQDSGTRDSLSTDSAPHEIRLQPFDSTRDALEALRTGEVHLVDRLDPAIAARLLTQTSENLVVDHYPAPVLHLLVPNFDNPYLRNRDFRRGLLYGINRQDILHDRLLAGQELDGCRMISGPIPIGVSPDDPVSYGYDLTIAPRRYEPLMSVALREMANIELGNAPESEGPGFPPLEKLIVGHPGSEVSHQVCLAIVQYLKRVGLPCELKVVDPETTNPSSVGVDLLYVEIQVAEPLADVPRIFEAYVPALFQPHYFQLGIRKLRESRSWQEVRENFWALHRLAHDDLLILPLFQLRDHFAYHRGLGGVGYQPMTLFQQVERWEIQPALETIQD